MFVCFENKPIVILLLLLFVILIAWFSIGKARSQEFGTNQVGWGWRGGREGFTPFSLSFSPGWGRILWGAVHPPPAGAPGRCRDEAPWGRALESCCCPWKDPFGGIPSPRDGAWAWLEWASSTSLGKLWRSCTDGEKRKYTSPVVRNAAT